MFDALLDQIAKLKSAVAGKPEFRWGVVSGVTPLQVTLDADPAPLAGVPSTLVAGLVVGQRVQCVIQNHRVTVVGASAGGVPTGTLLSFAGGTAPDGFLLCDGSVVLRAAFPALFAVIGTVFGAGDGSTTFALPDMRGRVPAGYDSTQTEFNALGKTFGTKTHTLTIAEMPSHNHAPLSNSVFHGTKDGNTQGLVANPSVQTGGDATTANRGGGGAHNNIQPSLTVNFIIKT